MHLRQRGYDFILPNIKYEFNKRYLIARSHFGYRMPKSYVFVLCVYLCILFYNLILWFNFYSWCRSFAFLFGNCRYQLTGKIVWPKSRPSLAWRKPHTSRLLVTHNHELITFVSLHHDQLSQHLLSSLFFAVLRLYADDICHVQLRNLLLNVVLIIDLSWSARSQLLQTAWLFSSIIVL